MRIGKGAWFYVALVAGFLVLGWTIIRLSEQGQQIRALSTALTQEQGAARSEGRTPVAPPPKEIIQSPGTVAEGPPPPLRPPPVDVDAIVRAVLARIPTPTDGRDGKDAPPVTPAQIQAAVTVVCQQRGCGPTDEQVATRVATYLVDHPPPAGQNGADGAPGQDGADGAQGPAGPEGPAGPAGRDGDPGIGIASISDVAQDGDTCTITITLTDGATKDLTWTCRPSADPTTPPPAPPSRRLLGGP